MNFQEFLENLKSLGFKVIGKSFAFKDFGDWSVAFIRMLGKFQFPGTICFVICAKPKYGKGLEGTIAHESKNPHDYPFKLIPGEIDKDLKYESRILNFPTEFLKTDADWSYIQNLLLKDLSDKLNALGVLGLKRQLKTLKNPGYIEKIWLEEDAQT